MKVIPIGDKLVIQRLEGEEKTSGGIFLPDAAREKPAEGRVLSVGDGRLLRDGSRARFQVSEGDRVIFSSYAGMEFNIDGDEMLVLSESDVLAVVS